MSLTVIFFQKIIIDEILSFLDSQFMARSKSTAAKATGGSKSGPLARRKPQVKSRNPRTQASCLALAKAKNPLLTSDEYAAQAKISASEVLRMRHFLAEYMRDFCEKSAAIRMGYPEDSAMSTGRLLLFHSYSQIKLLEMMDVMEISKMISAQSIIARLWREANDDGGGMFNNASNRLVALKTLAKIIGLENPKPLDDITKLSSGGVMLVPMAMNADEWGAFAMASQQALKDSTAIDV